MAFNYLVKGEMNKEDYFFTVNMISKSFYPYLEMLLDIDESDERFPNDGTKYHYDGIVHLLNIGALDYDGQIPMLINEKTNEIESRPCIIVTLNCYGNFIRGLLSMLNESLKS